MQLKDILFHFFSLKIKQFVSSESPSENENHDPSISPLFVYFKILCVVKIINPGEKGRKYIEYGPTEPKKTDEQGIEKASGFVLWLSMKDRGENYPNSP